MTMIDRCELYINNDKQKFPRNGKHSISRGIYGETENVTLPFLQLTRFPDGNTTINVNLRKYFFGEHSAQDLTLTQAQEAIGKMQNEYSYSLEHATVKYLEFGKTLQMNKLPFQYYCAFGEVSRYVPFWAGKTRYFTQTGKSFLFYDKGIEIVANGGRPFLNKNLLRYEMKLKNPKAIREFFGGVAPTMRELCNKTLFDKCLAAWQNFYFEIPKTNAGTLPLEKCTTMSTGRDLITAFGIQLAGLQAIDEKISAMPLTTQNRCLLKKELKRICAEFAGTEPNAMTTELSKKIKEIIYENE